MTPGGVRSTGWDVFITAQARIVPITAIAPAENAAWCQRCDAESESANVHIRPNATPTASATSDTPVSHAAALGLRLPFRVRYPLNQYNAVELAASTRSPIGTLP